jgi:hypothetical protein
MPARAHAFASIAFALSILASTETLATAQRTFVASYGSDANPCSLTLPCRGFAAAVSQTNAGGEVIVLDSAGYGPVTITQSVSIIAPAGVYAGISVPVGGTGILIDGIAIAVKLSGISINGLGGGGGGALYGIRMVNGFALTVDKCAIANFPNIGIGISIQPLAVAGNLTTPVVTISATTVENIGQGIVVGFGAFATIADSKIVRNQLAGVTAAGGPADTWTSVVVADTAITGTGIGVSTITTCINNEGSPGATSHIFASRVTVSGCLYGVRNGPQFAGTVTVGSSTVTGNETGFYQQLTGGGTGPFISLGNNLVSGNVIADTNGTITTIGGK